MSSKSSSTISTRSRKYYQENREKIAERNKKYREANKEKIAEHKKKYYQENKEKIAERYKKYVQSQVDNNPNWYKEKYKKEAALKSTNKESFAKNKYSSQKHGAKIRNIEWKLDKAKTISDIVNATHCAISGVKLIFKIGNKHAPSIDRKNSNRGYVPGNVQIVSTIVNKMKHDLSTREFKSICSKIANVA